MQTPSHVTVCICTFQRNEMLERLLRRLAAQNTSKLFSFGVVVCDNDASSSAQAVVARIGEKTKLPICYTGEPLQNISLARNRAVANASGDYIAFIDDDEFPEPDWLLRLFESCEPSNVAGVLGPVLPHFEETPPAWVVTGKLYDRPRHPTGFQLAWPECRTGNVMFKRALIIGDKAPFNPEFGTGGEDQDFFRRMMERGHQFVWCDEAMVWETVPPERWKVSVMLSRALLRGKNSLRHGNGWSRGIAKSLVAVPAYILVLPFLLVLSRHRFFRYLVRLFDHFGRLLACLGLNPVNKRVG